MKFTEADRVARSQKKTVSAGFIFLTFLLGLAFFVLEATVSAQPVPPRDWSAKGRTSHSRFGQAIATAGDVNRDGFDDVIVGAPLDDGVVERAGAVYLYLGAEDGLSESPRWRVLGSQTGSLLGSSVASAGDVNGDGFADVIVGAPLYDGKFLDSGAVFVWYGSEDGLGRSATPEEADWVATVNIEGAKFGQVVIGAGDVNLDGIGDIAVGAYDYGGRGRVFVWHGSKSGGLGPTGTTENVDWSVQGAVLNQKFGFALAAGDLNGDRISDLVIGSPGYQSDLGLLGRGRAGRGLAEAYLGSRQRGLLSRPSWAATVGELFGFSLAVGDVLPDGYDDIVVGAPESSVSREQQGAVYLFHGSATGPARAPIWTRTGPQEGAQYGRSLAVPGDVNGDKIADILSGTPLYEDLFGQQTGLVELFLSGPEGPPIFPDWSKTGGSGQSFAETLAGAGKVNQDPLFDFLIGAPDLRSAIEPIGGVFLVWGNPNIHNPPVLQSLTVNPLVIQAGSTATGTIQLSHPAPAGGVVVSLSSSESAVVSVPASVTVPAGSQTGNFTVSTFSVAMDTAAVITASLDNFLVSSSIIVQPVLPPFFTSPPGTLLIGDFVLTVQSYSSLDWDFDQEQIINAGGTATLLLNAKGNNVTVTLNFSDLTIEPVVQGTGRVVDGSVSYPTGSLPTPIELSIAGFKQLIDSFVLTPSTATAMARLEFPLSIVDVGPGAECHSARVDLGQIEFNPLLEYFWISEEAFGPWEIGHTTLEISGTGFVIDLSTTQTALPSPPYPNLPPSWEGVILREGSTSFQSSVVSNTGYLRAPYAFRNALVESGGLTGSFSYDTGVQYSYSPLQPLGYEITFSLGKLHLAFSQITGGTLHNGGVATPKKAVVTSGLGPWGGTFSTLIIQNDLDLVGTVDISRELHWGEFSQTSPELRAYSFDPKSGSGLDAAVYFSSRVTATYYPLTPGDDFNKPNLSGDLLFALESQEIQGLTLRVHGDVGTFKIYTPDIPGANQAAFDPIKGQFFQDSFINIASQGIHGELAFQKVDDSVNPEIDLGPTYRPDYQGGTTDTSAGAQVPFDCQFLLSLVTNPDVTDKRVVMLFRFVDSALYESDARGQVKFGQPFSGSLPFEKLQFTSTAHISAARVVLGFPNTVPISYWDLDLGQKPNTSEAGVLHPKSGKIYLTNATLSEPRHFSRPFCLIWGVIQANGQIGELKFNYDNSGQKFDGFSFNPQIIRLSEWDAAADVTTDPFLQVAGGIHFDFFGEYSLDIRDHRHLNAGPPHNGREIRLGTDGLNGADPSQLDIAGSWDGTFGDALFTIGHDAGDQDGFLGSGSMGLLYVSGDLDASLNLTRDRICMSVHDGVEDGFEDVSLPPMASFTVLGRTTGCGCIEDGTLKRLHLQSEVETSANVTAVVRTGDYMSIEMDWTPATSYLAVHGSMLLSLAAGAADVEAVAHAEFLFDREQNFTEGDLQGRFNASSFMSVAGGLSAEGHLSWHLGEFGNGAEDYHALQGKVAVAIVAPGGTLGAEIEGGFFVGLNTPKTDIWVLTPTDPNITGVVPLLPDRVTGAYGFAKYANSINLYVISGGYEMYAGAGAFVDGFEPLVVGNMRGYVWGEFLGGLLSASAWLELAASLQLSNPKFQGTAGMEACVAWVFCGEVDVTVTVDKTGISFDD